MKQRLGEFFLQQDNVLIDGRKLKPILDRIAFVKYARTGSTFLIQPERLPVHTAMVGVIVTYVTKELPQEVTSEWNLRKQKKDNRSFGIHLGLVVAFIAGSIGLYPFLHLAVAKPAILAPKMTDNNAVIVLDSLLNNIYRSFDFREEENIYDRLATSVSGDLLSEIYLQHRKSMVVSQAGGAQARVKAIEILDVDVSHPNDRRLSLLFHAKWTAIWGQ